MTNDPKADLIYAILAMDSYNRGYGSGIASLSDAKNVTIGDWRIDETAETLLAPGTALNAGFYAISYRNATTGNVVISYRGTDNLKLLTDGSNDIQTGNYGDRCVNP